MSDSVAVSVTVNAPKKRGRPPKAKPVVTGPSLAVAPKKRGRPPKEKSPKPALGANLGTLHKSVRASVQRWMPDDFVKAKAAKKLKRTVQSAPKGVTKRIEELVLESGHTLVVRDGGGMLTIDRVVMKKGSTLVDETRGSSNVQILSVTRDPGSVRVTKN